MSVRLMSLVWDVTWPTQSHLLVMLKLADHANDDGDNVRPGKPRIARQSQCSEGTVKNALRAFRDCGILHVIQEGGSGPKSPTVYRINVPLLTALARANADLDGSASVVEIPEEFYPQGVNEKGSTIDPLLSTRGQSDEAKGSICPSKGSKLLTPNHHLEPSIEPSARECAREGENFGLGKSEVPTQQPRSLPSFVIKRGDAQWSDWISHLTDINPGLAFDAEAAGEMTVFGSKWPDNATGPTKVKKSNLTDRSRQMTGETAQ